MCLGLTGRLGCGSVSHQVGRQNIYLLGLYICVVVHYVQVKTILIVQTSYFLLIVA